MRNAIIPDFQSAALIDQQAKADVTLCWMCGTCDAECPINTATARLSPRKIVRMATLGLIEELANLPEVWYCTACNRCGQTCPTLVTPSRMIARIRQEAVLRGIMSWTMHTAYTEFFSAFQRVRWQVVSRCFSETLTRLSDSQWYEWLNTPIEIEKSVIGGDGALKRRRALGDILSGAETLSCFTCSECTNACPLKGEKTIFNPLWITRMANLGLTDELLRSPAIWLCVQCRQCTEACSQAVKVHSLIESLRGLAIKQGIVDPGFQTRLKKADRIVYPRFVEEVDRILAQRGLT
jgi:heterodisulfide reductase subunit C